MRLREGLMVLRALGGITVRYHRGRCPTISEAFDPDPDPNPP
jgi:hypothetical protein